jgi:hypothetical protein
MLAKLALRAAERGAIGIEQHRAGRGRALVDDDDLFGHIALPPSHLMTKEKGGDKA